MPDLPTNKAAGAPAGRGAVALYFYRFGAKGGGAQRMALALANGLHRRGFKVVLVSWDPPGAEAFYPLDSGIVWHKLGFGAGSADKLRRTLALAKVLRDEGAGVLVGFVMSGDKTVYGAAKLAGARIVAAERNGPSMYRYRQGRLQRMASFALLHLCARIAVQMADYASGYPASLRGRIAVIPNPVPTASARAVPDRPGAEGRNVILCAGRLDEVQKRIGVLIEAFGLIAGEFPDWDVRIVGDGEGREALLRLVAGKGLSERVRLEPARPDIFAVYPAAQLFAIPSRWEGFPNSLAEAMAHGLPAVGFAGAEGVNGLIEDGVTGWLAAGNDDALSLAATLRSALTSGPERAKRGKAAAAAMAAYEAEAQFDRWAALLQPLAGRT